MVGGDNKVSIREVQVGAQVGADVIVTQGLKPGDRVVVSGTQLAREGSTIVPAAAPASRKEH